MNHFLFLICSAHSTGVKRTASMSIALGSLLLVREVMDPLSDLHNASDPSLLSMKFTHLIYPLI